MRGQWFGDVNDYFKYGLLRLIAQKAAIRIGVCWMLTRDDRYRYLSQPGDWRGCDPKLYDSLARAVRGRDARSVAGIENNRILPGCRFYSAELSDDAQARKQYFDDMTNALGDCDLLFLDPDNGLEVDSCQYGRKHSSRYLYWREVQPLYRSGFSLLIFQYHRRVKYHDLIKRLQKESIRHIDVKPQFYYRTANVTLVLLAQPKHERVFQNVSLAIERTWGSKIRALSGPDKHA